jgi:hypothetical protein
MQKLPSTKFQYPNNKEIPNSSNQCSKRLNSVIGDLYRFSKISSEIYKDGISGCRKKPSNNGTFF